MPAAAGDPMVISVHRPSEDTAGSMMPTSLRPHQSPTTTAAGAGVAGASGNDLEESPSRFSADTAMRSSPGSTSTRTPQGGASVPLPVPIGGLAGSSNTSNPRSAVEEARMRRRRGSSLVHLQSSHSFETITPHVHSAASSGKQGAALQSPAAGVASDSSKAKGDLLSDVGLEMTQRSSNSDMWAPEHRLKPPSTPSSTMSCRSVDTDASSSDEDDALILAEARVAAIRMGRVDPATISPAGRPPRPNELPAGSPMARARVGGVSSTVTTPLRRDRFGRPDGKVSRPVSRSRVGDYIHGAVPAAQLQRSPFSEGSNGSSPQHHAGGGTGQSMVVGRSNSSAQLRPVATPQFVPHKHALAAPDPSTPRAQRAVAGAGATAIDTTSGGAGVSPAPEPLPESGPSYTPKYVATNDAECKRSKSTRWYSSPAQARGWAPKSTTTRTEESTLGPAPGDTIPIYGSSRVKVMPDPATANTPVGQKHGAGGPLSTPTALDKEEAEKRRAMMEVQRMGAQLAPFDSNWGRAKTPLLERAEMWDRAQRKTEEGDSSGLSDDDGPAPALATPASIRNTGLFTGDGTAGGSRGGSRRGRRSTRRLPSAARPLSILGPNSVPVGSAFEGAGAGHPSEGEPARPATTPLTWDDRVMSPRPLSTLHGTSASPVLPDGARRKMRFAFGQQTPLALPPDHHPPTFVPQRALTPQLTPGKTKREVRHTMQRVVRSLDEFEATADDHRARIGQPISRGELTPREGEPTSPPPQQQPLYDRSDSIRDSVVSLSAGASLTPATRALQKVTSSISQAGGERGTGGDRSRSPSVAARSAGSPSGSPSARKDTLFGAQVGKPQRLSRQDLEALASLESRRRSSAVLAAVTQEIPCPTIAELFARMTQRDREDLYISLVGGCTIDLSRDKFRLMVLRVLGPRLGVMVSEEHISSLFNLFDINRGGTVSYFEYLEVLCNSLLTEPQTRFLDKVFSRLVDVREGKLSFAEKQKLRKLQQEMQAAAVAEQYRIRTGQPLIADKNRVLPPGTSLQDANSKDGPGVTTSGSFYKQPSSRPPVGGGDDGDRVFPLVVSGGGPKSPTSSPTAAGSFALARGKSSAALKKNGSMTRSSTALKGGKDQSGDSETTDRADTAIERRARAAVRIATLARHAKAEPTLRKKDLSIGKVRKAVFEQLQRSVLFPHPREERLVKALVKCIAGMSPADEMIVTKFRLLVFCDDAVMPVLVEILEEEEREKEKEKEA